MAKWSSHKPKFDEQRKFWVKVPKNAEDYKDENVKSNFKDVDCFEFLFNSFDRTQILELSLTQVSREVSDKERVQQHFDKFIFNIVDWKNIKVNDIDKQSDITEEIDFDVEALTDFFTINFWATEYFIHQVGESVANKKDFIDTQKKT